MTVLKWIAVILIAFWIIGLIFNIAGTLIHWVLLAAVVVFIVDLFTGNKTKS